MAKRRYTAEEIVTALRPLINRLTLRHPSVPTRCSFSDVPPSLHHSDQVTNRLVGGSAFADHILSKIGDHLRRSCAGAAMHRDLLYAHAAQRFYPLH